LRHVRDPGCSWDGSDAAGSLGSSARTGQQLLAAARLGMLTGRLDRCGAPYTPKYWIGRLRGPLHRRVQDGVCELAAACPAGAKK